MERISTDDARRIIKENKDEAKKILVSYDVPENNLHNFVKGLKMADLTLGFFRMVATLIKTAKSGNEHAKDVIQPLLVQQSKSNKKVTGGDLRRAADAVDLAGEGKGMPIATVIGYITKIVTEVWIWSMFFTQDMFWLPRILVGAAS